MSALIIRHPSHAVTLSPSPDPRDPPVLPADLRAVPPELVGGRPRFDALTEDQVALLEAVDVLERLADRLGSYQRVENVLKTVAMIHGEDLERPLDRCLLDGTILPPSRICSRCGRDNN